LETESKAFSDFFLLGEVQKYSRWCC